MRNNGITMVVERGRKTERRRELVNPSVSKVCLNHVTTGSSPCTVSKTIPLQNKSGVTSMKRESKSSKSGCSAPNIQGQKRPKFEWSEKQIPTLQQLGTQYIARSGMEQAVSSGILVGRPFGGVSIAWSPSLNHLIMPL